MATEAAYWAKKNGLKITLVDKAALDRSGAVAMVLSAINQYVGLRDGDNTLEDYVRYVRQDLMGISREDLVYNIARHVDSSVHLFEKWGLKIWLDEDGKYVSLLYMVEYFDNAVPKKIIPETDTVSLEEYSVYNKNELIVVIEGPHLLDFDLRTKSPKVVINYIFGREDVAKGIQYTGMGRETVGNYRATLLALAIIDFFILMVFIYCLLKKRKKYVRDSWNLEL